MTNRTHQRCWSQSEKKQKRKRSNKPSQNAFISWSPFQCLKTIHTEINKTHTESSWGKTRLKKRTSRLLRGIQQHIQEHKPDLSSLIYQDDKMTLSQFHSCKKCEINITPKQSDFMHFTRSLLPWTCSLLSRQRISSTTKIFKCEIMQIKSKLIKSLSWYYTTLHNTILVEIVT